jgi:hypothetical protein
VTRRLLTLCAVASLLLVSACSGGDDAEPPAATLDTKATTSTTQSPEAEVEAAYLHSWDVYADAVLNLDDSKLSSDYAGDALTVVVGDVEQLRAEGAVARMSVEHNYTITVQQGVAQVIDRYTNHSVKLDAATREAMEPDPNEVVNEQYLLQKLDGTWKVIDISPAP